MRCWRREDEGRIKKEEGRKIYRICGDKLIFYIKYAKYTLYILG